MAQGVPGPKCFYAQGLVGLATDAGMNAATVAGEILSIVGPAAELSEEGLAGPVGWAKFGIDGTLYVAAYECCVNHR
jgi:hypothetical protein